MHHCTCIKTECTNIGKCQMTLSVPIHYMCHVGKLINRCTMALCGRCKKILRSKYFRKWFLCYGKKFVNLFSLNGRIMTLSCTNYNFVCKCNGAANVACKNNREMNQEEVNNDLLWEHNRKEREEKYSTLPC